MFRIFGPRYLSALKPQLTVFTGPNLKPVCERSLYWTFLCSKPSCIIGTARLPFVLCNSGGNILRSFT